MKFTPTQREILLHRLCVPDALADCLEEGFEREEVMFTAGVLAQQIQQGEGWDFEEASELEKAIIKDCCNGSTFFASSEDAVATGEISRGKLRRWNMAADLLEDTLKAVGVKAEIPRW